MNRADLKDKIRIQKMYVADCEEDARTAGEALKLLEVQLAEEEKPEELKHLDWGPDKNGHLKLALCTNEGTDSRIIQASMEPDGGLQVFEIANDRPIMSVKGNFATDLAAIAEPLTECSLNGVIEFRLDEVGRLAGSFYGGNVAVPMEAAAEFILNLQRLLATAKRKEHE